MSAKILDIADAVVSTLNGAGLSPTFTAERLYVPVYEVRNLTGLRVAVVANSVATTLLNRGTAKVTDYVVDVGIHKRYGQGPMTELQIRTACDPFMTLAESIGDLFLGLPLSAVAGCSCTASDNRVIYDPRYMDGDKVFATVVGLTFRLARS